MEILDVTQIEPRLKHPTIFERFDNLNFGQAFIIRNDHDPKPLYYQLLAERGKVFEWEYLEEGPEIWKVKISKNNEDEKSTTIGEMVAEDFRKAEVFRKFGLDFCCGGNRSVKEACKKKGIDENELEKALVEVEKVTKNHQQNYDSWELDFLADYIVNTHHSYITESTPMLNEISDKVARVHGENHPEVIEIARLFKAVAEELKMHMHKEEHILFPYIKELAVSHREKKIMQPSSFGSIVNPIRMMEMEHISVGGNLDKIHELSNAFKTPEGACSSYQVLYAKLSEFEQDLQQHIHLENNILFPKAIKLEKDLLE